MTVLECTATVMMVGATVLAESQELLPQKPTINQTEIVFAYASHLWSVPREGGTAIRLTFGTGTETDPHFSPDGTQIAYTGESEGNSDVYVIPAMGGIPRRLTYHPAPDTVVGWTPDGSHILFRSLRNSYSRFGRLFTVSLSGDGLPTELPLPMAEEGSYSSDLSSIAYVPVPRAFRSWKGYRGGRTTSIWIAHFSDLGITKIPRNNSNDFGPMWVKNKIYFLSDRNGAVTLFAYDPLTNSVSELVHNIGLDIKSAAAGTEAIVYEQFGELWVYDLTKNSLRQVSIVLRSDLPDVHPHFEGVGDQIANASLSPSGARAVFEAHGDILTVPAGTGTIRNLTKTPGIAERDPAWSPDGKRIAYFSDESGEYELHVSPVDGSGGIDKFHVCDPPSLLDKPVWSPDSSRIAYTSRLTLSYIDLETRSCKNVAKDVYDSAFRGLNPSWSPDGKWLAYTQLLRNHFRAVFLFSADDARSYQITDGMSDAEYPVFDKNGRYLYFTASTDAGLTTAWLDMSSYGRQVTRSVYLILLRKSEPSPLGPEADEEHLSSVQEGDPSTQSGTSQADAKESQKATRTVIDLAGIEQRTLALPISSADYTYLFAGTSGTLLLMEHPAEAGDQWGSSTIYRFVLKTRKTLKLLDGVGSFDISNNGQKMLYVLGGKWTIAPVEPGSSPGEGALNTQGMEVWVEPKAEWAQMYHEVWRIERDLFYDPGLHGLQLDSVEANYLPFLSRVGSRSDLNYLFQEMLGWLRTGHVNVEGGTRPPQKRASVGLLGADYKIDHGRYRFKHIYEGENWNPRLRAPLTEPSVDVREGEYLLAINGRELAASDNVYRLFENTAGEQVVLRVGPNPSGAGSREVSVVPLDSELYLRKQSWIEKNRELVYTLSGGRIAYIYLPDTGEEGYRSFNRYYFSQIDKQGAIIDERFNPGGGMGDYIVECLSRPLLNLWHTREGEDFATPQNQIFGPKVLIVNELSQSGADALAWLFRREQLGTIVGKRTWGGVVGTFNIPQLMDGGFVTAPNLAFYSPGGEWEVENRGVAPDIEVDMDPLSFRTGHDPQLERAVGAALLELEKHPVQTYRHPNYPR